MRDDSVVPRLSFGKGDGPEKMCGMQAVSWQTGDTIITDFPDCSARPLAVLVQYLNDELAFDDGFLSAEDGLAVLDLGWLTVGTGGAGEKVKHLWYAELLSNPDWGVSRFLQGNDRWLCEAAAGAHLMAAEDMQVEWIVDATFRDVGVEYRTSLQHLCMYVVDRAVSGVDEQLESAVRIATHANFSIGTSKEERVAWVRQAIESWLSIQHVEVVCPLAS